MMKKFASGLPDPCVVSRTFVACAPGVFELARRAFSTLLQYVGKLLFSVGASRYSESKYSVDRSADTPLEEQDAALQTMYRMSIDILRGQRTCGTGPRD